MRQKGQPKLRSQVKDRDQIRNYIENVSAINHEQITES